MKVLSKLYGFLWKYSFELFCLEWFLLVSTASLVVLWNRREIPILISQAASWLWMASCLGASLVSALDFFKTMRSSRRLVRAVFGYALVAALLLVQAQSDVINFPAVFLPAWGVFTLLTFTLIRVGRSRDL